jgi:primosomal protein N' (replication factor Y)
VRVARLDRDTAQGKGLRRILARVGRREVDVLVGTQMVTKGHDFPHITLVGVIGADLGLHFPDFRAAERTFQLLTQVAGRAGRGGRAGRVLIQTYSPTHPSLRHAAAHDYESFFDSEIAARQELSYPPAAHLAAVHLDGTDAGAVVRAAGRLASRAQGSLRRLPGVTLLGPTEAPIQKLKDRVRWMLLLKSRERGPLRQALREMLRLADELRKGRVRITVDVDPVSML